MFYICKWIFKKKKSHYNFDIGCINRCYFITKLLLLYIYLVNTDIDYQYYFLKYLIKMILYIGYFFFS